MSAYLYYHPGIEVPQRGPARWRTERWNELTETVGARQLELLLRARSSSTGTLVLPHNRERDTERSAARRLVLRGLLHAPNAMTAGAWSNERRCWLYFYGLTERGRTAWLRVKA